MENEYLPKCRGALQLGSNDLFHVWIINLCVAVSQGVSLCEHLLHLSSHFVLSPGARFTKHPKMILG